MGTLNAMYPTLVDLSQLPENKDAADIVDLAKQFNPILEDAIALPCNQGMKHLTTILTGLPSGTWARMYKGIQPSKSTRQQVEDTTGLIESRSEVDCRIIDVIEKAEDKMSMRMAEAEAHIEGLSQDVAEAIFYADSGLEPEKPMGIAPRFNSTTAENGGQIVDAEGTGNNLTSIYIITWSKQACHLLYPNKGTIGIQREAWPNKVDAFDADGNVYAAYREDFKWHVGVSVRNWQYVVRIANIDVSSLTTDAATGSYLVDLLTEGYYRHKGRRSANGKTFIYMSTNILKYLDYQARNKANTNLFLTFNEFGPNAKEILHFRGLPIRETDAILETEEAVV
jgi:hypothetical protein